MAYQIKPGVSEKELPKWLEQATKRYGTFEDGRVDYTHANIAPTVMCTVYCKGKILLAKRGHGLADAEGVWSIINGFIDEIKPVKRIVIQEMHEELSVVIKPRNISVGKSHTMKSSQEKRSYIVFPCLVKLSAIPEIKLDREHTDFAWITRSQLENYEFLDGLPAIIDFALELL